MTSPTFLTAVQMTQLTTALIVIMIAVVYIAFKLISRQDPK